MDEIERNDKIINKLDKPMRRLKAAKFSMDLSLVLSVLGMLGCWAYFIFDLPTWETTLIVIGTVISLVGYKYAVDWYAKAFVTFVKATQQMIDELNDPFHDEDDEDDG